MKTNKTFFNQLFLECTHCTECWLFTRQKDTDRIIKANLS